MCVQSLNTQYIIILLYLYNSYIIIFRKGKKVTQGNHLMAGDFNVCTKYELVLSMFISTFSLSILW